MTDTTDFPPGAMHLWIAYDNHTYAELPHDIEPAMAMIKEAFTRDTYISVYSKQCRGIYPQAGGKESKDTFFAECREWLTRTLAAAPSAEAPTGEGAARLRGLAMFKKAKDAALANAARETWDAHYFKCTPQVSLELWTLIWRKAVEWWSGPIEQAATGAPDDHSVRAALVELVAALDATHWEQANVEWGKATTFTPTAEVRFARAIEAARGIASGRRTSTVSWTDHSAAGMPELPRYPALLCIWSELEKRAITAHGTACYEAGRTAARDVALEEAAQICDAQQTEGECPERASYCADAIRALKGKT